MSFIPVKQTVNSGDTNYSPSADAVYSFVSTSTGSLASKTLNNLSSPTAINQSLLFGSDGLGDIGASGASRPNNLYVKTAINLDSLTASAFVGSDSSKNLVSLTAAVATSYLDTFTSSLKGLVPASGGGTTNFLRADGTWAASSVSFPLRAPNGTQTAPSYSFTNNTNSGLYADATTLYIGAGGNEMMKMVASDIYVTRNIRFDNAVFGLNNKSVAIGLWQFTGTGHLYPTVDATTYAQRYYSIGRAGDVQDLSRPYRIDVARTVTVGKKVGSSSFAVYGATLGVSQNDDVTTSFTTTANNSTTIVSNSGDGIQTMIHIGDYIQLNGLSTVARVTNFTFSYPNATLTVDTALGDGTSRAIIVKQNIASFRKSDGTEVLQIKNDGNVGIGIVPTVKLDVSGSINSDGEGNYIGVDAGGESRLGFLKLSGTGPCLAAYGDFVFRAVTNQLKVVGPSYPAYNGSEIMRLTSVGDLGIGTSSPATKLHVQKTSLATNTITNILRIDSQSSGTPASGIGTGIEMATETAAGNTEIGVVLEAVTTDVTSTAENFDFVIKNMTNGATASEKLRITSTGDISVANGNLILNTAGNGLKIKTGTDATAGIETGISGATFKTINTAKALTGSLIFVQPINTTDKHGFSVSSINNGVSFTVDFSGTYTGDLAWIIINPA